jgi:hypothetical protein
VRDPRLEASDPPKELNLETLKEESEISLTRPSYRVNLFRCHLRLAAFLFASLSPTPSQRLLKGILETEDVGTPKRSYISRSSQA